MVEGADVWMIRRGDRLRFLDEPLAVLAGEPFDCHDSPKAGITGLPHSAPAPAKPGVTSRLGWIPGFHLFKRQRREGSVLQGH